MAGPLGGPRVRWGCKILRLFLAFRTEMSASPAEQEALDRSFAGEAWLSCAQIDAMPQLKESLLALSVDIIGDGRPPQLDGMSQYLTDGVI